MNDVVGSADRAAHSAHLYAKLLTWLDARRPGLVARDPLEDARQLHRHQGARLALLYATNATDAETLLQPTVYPAVLIGSDPAVTALERSVLRALVSGDSTILDATDCLDDLLRGFAAAYDAISQDSDAFCQELTASALPGEHVDDALPVSGLDSAVAKVHAMGPEDRRRQEWMIEAAFATRTGTVRHWCLATGSTVDAGVPDPQRALDHAAAVARELSALAYRDHGRVNWLGLEPLENGQWTVLPTGLGLSHGYTGIALFLAQLGTLTGDSRWLDLAADATASAPALLTALAERPEHLAAIGGGFTGMGGVAYALGRLAALLDSADLRDAAGLAADLAARAAVGDPPLPTHPDLFNDSWCHGLASRAAAGALDATDLTIWLARLATSPPLTDLTVCHGEFGVLEALAILAADHPQARATLERRAARLPDPIASGAAFNGTPGAVPTPGFLHGLAGVGYGLLRVAFPKTVPSVLLPEAPATRGASKATP